MSRKKLGNACKVHTTATISSAVNTAIIRYQNDRKNIKNGEKPKRSAIIEKALEAFLVEYMKGKEDLLMNLFS